MLKSNRGSQFRKPLDVIISAIGNLELLLTFILFIYIYILDVEKPMAFHVLELFLGHNKMGLEWIPVRVDAVSGADLGRGSRRVALRV
jgi:hypothetical protein